MVLRVGWSGAPGIALKKSKNFFAYHFRRMLSSITNRIWARRRHLDECPVFQVSLFPQHQDTPRIREMVKALHHQAITVADCQGDDKPHQGLR